MRLEGCGLERLGTWLQTFGLRLVTDWKPRFVQRRASASNSLISQPQNTTKPCLLAWCFQRLRMSKAQNHDSQPFRLDKGRLGTMVAGEPTPRFAAAVLSSPRASTRLEKGRLGAMLSSPKPGQHPVPNPSFSAGKQVVGNNALGLHAYLSFCSSICLMNRTWVAAPER